MRWILVLGLLLFAGASQAADGDLIDSFLAGNVRVDRFKLCDGTPDGQCAAFDLEAYHNISQCTGAAAPFPGCTGAGTGTVGKAGKPPKLRPDWVSIGFELAAGCTAAATLMPQVSSEADVDPRSDLVTVEWAKPAANEFNGGEWDFWTYRYITAANATTTNCTDLEAILTLVYLGH